MINKELPWHEWVRTSVKAISWPLAYRGQARDIIVAGLIAAIGIARLMYSTKAQGLRESIQKCLGLLP
jgi:hypothetical protein